MVNLDTHILIHALNGDLTASEERVLRKQPWGVSSIVLWEITKLHAKGRISIGLENPLLRHALSKVLVWDLSQDVCLAIRLLDFSSDPADEIIAATSLVHGAQLVTRDERILRSKLIPFAA